MSKKKIMIVIPGMNYGGMERVAFITRDMLLKKGYEVQFITLYRGNQEYNPSFDYTSLDCEVRKSKFGKIITTIARIVKLKRQKRKLRPDYVLSFGQNANFCNVFSKNKEKLILGIRSYDWLYSYFFNFKLEKIIYRNADLVLSVSKLIKEEAEKTFDIPTSKSDFLYNPYNLKEINLKAKEPIFEIDIPEDKLVIVSVGRLEDQKGFYHLIKAIYLMSNKSSVIVYIIGTGTQRKRLEQLINDLDLQRHVFLIGGQENPYKFMKRANIYVMSSITEGFPNALVEAMAVGTPVLSTDCLSGPREILTNSDIYLRTSGMEYGEYGVLVEEMTDSKNYDPNFIEECDYILSNSISKIVKDIDKMSYYSVAGKKRVSQFSYEEFENKLVSHLL